MTNDDIRKLKMCTPLPLHRYALPHFSEMDKEDKKAIDTYCAESLRKEQALCDEWARDAQRTAAKRYKTARITQKPEHQEMAMYAARLERILRGVE